MASDFDVSKKLTEEVQKLFLNVENALHRRKAELLRQIEFLSQQYQMHNINFDCLDKIKILPDNEDDLLNVVKTFGKINFNEFYLDCDLFKVEDYQKPENDHVCLYKCLSVGDDTNDSLIVNVTNLKSNDILSKYQDNNSIDSVDNSSDTKELVVSCESVDSDVATSDPSRPKEKTMLECVLRQDPSLCSHNRSVKSVRMSTNSTDSDKIAQQLATTKDGNANSELHKSLSNEHQTLGEVCSCFAAATLNASSVCDSVSNFNCECNEIVPLENDEESPPGRTELTVPNGINQIRTSAEYLLNVTQENVRKLSMEHPVLIQQWMKQIIAEPETEPVQNNDFLEHKQY